MHPPKPETAPAFPQDDLPPAEDERADRRAVSRLCIVSRKVKPVGTLLRFVEGPDGSLVPDLRNRLPGRGVWVSAHRQAVEEAGKRKLFARALRRPVSSPADLAESVAALLAKEALQMLALANKAGAIVAGFDKIDGMRSPILALVQAADGSEAEIARLARACRGRAPRKADPPSIRAFTAAQLGLCIGREHVVHVGLIVKDVCLVFLERARLYCDFQSGGLAEQHEASSLGLSGIGEDSGS